MTRMNAKLETEFKFCLKKGHLQASLTCKHSPCAIHTTVSFAIFRFPPASTAWQPLNHWRKVCEVPPTAPGYVWNTVGFQICVFISSLNRNPSQNLFLDKLQKVTAALDT